MLDHHRSSFIFLMSLSIIDTIYMEKGLAGVAYSLQILWSHIKVSQNVSQGDYLCIDTSDLLIDL